MPSRSFQIFLYRHIKLLKTLENSVCYCYTSYEMTDQFYDFRFKSTATAAIGIHPTKAWLSQPVNFKNAIWTCRHAGHCWRSRDELIRDVLLWTPTHGRAKAGRPAGTYMQQLCEDTGFSPEDLPEAMNDREEWRERVRDIRATSATWWYLSWMVQIASQQHFVTFSFSPMTVPKLCWLYIYIILTYIYIYIYIYNHWYWVLYL